MTVAVTHRFDWVEYKITPHKHKMALSIVDSQTILNALPEAMFVVDKDGVILQANPAACTLIGKPIEQIAGQPVAQALSKWPALTKSLASIEQLEHISLPDTFQGEDRRWYQLTASPLHNDQGETIGWVLLLRDITQQYETERKNQQLAEVIEQAQEVIVITDLAGTITYANPHFESVTGYNVQEAIGKNPRILRSGSHDAAFYQKLWDVITSGETWSGRFINKRKDGTLYHEAAIIFPLKDKSGEITGYAATKRDITDQINAEKALESYARQQALLNKILHIAIQQTDFEQMIQALANHAGALLDANGCYITLWDEEKGMVIPGAASGPFENEYPNIQPVSLRQPSYTRKVLDAGEPIWISNIYDIDLDNQDIAPGILARIPVEPGLVLPLIAHGKKLGAVLLAFDSGRELTPEEIRLGAQAADQIALAMLTARLLKQAEQRAREAETLRLAGAAVVASLNQDETIERILAAMNQVMPYDSGAVLLPTNQATEMRIVGARGFERDIVGQTLPLNVDSPNKIVFDTGKPLIIRDVQKHYDNFRHPPYDHIHGWMGIPLTVQERVIGMLTLDSQEPGRFTPAHARLAQAFAAQVAIALENARLFNETRRLATTDELTQIANRRRFMELAQQEFQRAERYHKPLSLIMLDVDHFKKINDTYGHPIGDKTLQAIVRRCLKNLRTTDIMGRYGGEEFVILLPETALTQGFLLKGQHTDPIQPARTVAERLQQAFSQPIRVDGHTFTLTVSLGVTEYHPSDQNIRDLINRADQALLKAKSLGRNRVVTYPPEKGIA